MSELQFDVRIGSSGRPLVGADRYPVFPDKVTFLFGESGIGKSLLAKAVYGLLDPDELDITVNGRRYQEHRDSPWAREIRENGFFVFQEPSSHLNPLMRISDQLSEGSLGNAATEAAILEHLWDTRDSASIQKVLSVFPKPFRPSGGEKQRALLAMAFKKLECFQTKARPGASSFFVFDEPTGSLDNHYRNLFLELLFEKFEKRPFTALIVTHDYSIISEIYGRYPKLLPKILFKELARKGEHETDFRDFSAQEYLGWLHDIKPEKQAVRRGEAVLAFKSDFSAFGRSLAVYQDNARTKKQDLCIQKGEIVYIKAASGVGKTTLAKVVMGLYQADLFAMRLGNIDFTEKTIQAFWHDRIWGRKASMVFQHADEALDLEATVFETFAGLPLKEPMTRDALKEKLSILFKGEITDAFLDKKAGHLSGGQKQRLNLLRTLVLDTDLVIMDEPLNGLDFTSIQKVLFLLEERRKQGAAILMISHNEEIFDTFVGPEKTCYLGLRTD